MKQLGYVNLTAFYFGKVTKISHWVTYYHLKLTTKRQKRITLCIEQLDWSVWDERSNYTENRFTC